MVSDGDEPMKALKSIGVRKAIKFLGFTLLYMGYRVLPVSPLRIGYLRLLGARIGKDCVIHNAKFFNYYRTGFN